MTPLGDLLELLHGADKLTTFEGEFRDWLRPLPSTTLMVGADDAAPGRLRWGGAGPFPRSSQLRRRIWIAQPDQIRVELKHGSRLEHIGLRDRDRWSQWDRVTGLTTGDLATGGVPLPRLLDPRLLSPARLIGSLRFEPTGADERLGREVVKARARPRNPPSGADMVLDFEFDAEHGVVLRRTAAQNGRCVQVTEAMEVNFNRPVAPDRFALSSPV